MYWTAFVAWTRRVVAAVERAEIARIQHAHQQWAAIQRGAATQVPWR